MSYACFAPLVRLYAPTLLYPTHNLPKPQMPFIPYGFNIPKVDQESQSDCDICRGILRYDYVCRV